MEDRAYFVYMLECGDGTLYSGITNDLSRRITEHNESPKGAKYTKSRRPVRLVYSNVCHNKSEALKAERILKKLSRAQKLELAASWLDR